ncbi:MAG TPA: CDP-alcohol phosphatidyltransferase family protein [Candidatus Stackebrandtia excrementipullorum]|nr:CDP-alcohol phosphatidyltransferase family protein [Candidatus Stackebrandtia excrementipullorum]
MRTTPWRRRRVTDSPRPAGRGLGRLRRSSSLARRLVAIRPIHPIRTLRRRRDRTSVIESIDQPVIPISPAPAGASTYVDDPDAPPAPIPLLPGEPTARRRFYFCLANSCTVTSILLGMGAIMLALNGSVQIAAVLLLGCILMDALDGPLARRFGVASPFGAQMDSMADMCSFGIAAPLVVFQTMGADLPTWALGAACALVAVCAAIRLARFNVSPKDGRFFSGVPTTLAATVLALGTLLLTSPHVVMTVGIAMLALMMVSSFPYAKLSQLRKVPPWLWPLPVVGLLLSIEVTFIVLVAVYLLSGPVLWAVHRRQAIVA